MARDRPTVRRLRGGDRIGWLPVAVGLAALVAAALIVRDTVAFRGGAVRGRSYLPTVRFTDASGGTVVAESYVASSFYDYRVGEPVGVLYNPGRSRRVRIDGSLLPLALPGFFAGFGLLFLGVGVGVLRQGRER